MTLARLNWRRGLIRLWVILALPWIVATVALRWEHVADAFESLRLARSVDMAQTDCGPGIDAAQRSLCELKAQLREQTARNVARARQDLSDAVLWIAGPPVLLLILGGILAWVVRGFRSETD